MKAIRVPMPYKWHPREHQVDLWNALLDQEQKRFDVVAHRRWGKDEVALRNQIQDTMSCMKRDGTLAKLSEKWFGVAPAEYWSAFRQAAVKLELRRAAEAEYRLAARRAPKPEEKEDYPKGW